MTYFDYIGALVVTVLCLTIIAICVLGVAVAARIFYRWWQQ